MTSSFEHKRPLLSRPLYTTLAVSSCSTLLAIAYYFFRQSELEGTSPNTSFPFSLSASLFIVSTFNFAVTNGHPLWWIFGLGLATGVAYTITYVERTTYLEASAILVVGGLLLVFASDQLANSMGVDAAAKLESDLEDSGFEKTAVNL